MDNFGGDTLVGIVVDEDLTLETILDDETVLFSELVTEDTLSGVVEEPV